MAVRALFIIVAVAAALSAQEKEAFVPLFNGENLDGWVNVNCAPSTWTVRDGMIVCSGKPTGVLRTKKQYENFILELEWCHRKKGGNAGLFIWSDALTAPGQPFTRSVEVQIMDGHETDSYTSHGDVFSIHGARMIPDRPHPKGWARCLPSERRSKPAGQWNHYRVICRDGAIKLEVNGKEVSGGHDITPRKGYICLESEGSEVHFKNIRIHELPDSARRLEREEVAERDRGFLPLYNGVDLSGWKVGPEQEGHWRPMDWRLDYDGKGADLWSEKEYGDFILIADWRWTRKPEPAQLPVILPTGEYLTDEAGEQVKAEVPSAGDSGIYLRGNSKSQVNIWCWPVGSGEVYGYRTDMEQPPEVRRGVTPWVCADAPIGRWNRFVITMRGELLTVELNGKTVIRRARLPGVPARGPIALQHHGDPIQFANLFIREIGSERRRR